PPEYNTPGPLFVRAGKWVGGPELPGGVAVDVRGNNPAVAVGTFGRVGRRQATLVRRGDGLRSRADPRRPSRSLGGARLSGAWCGIRRARPGVLAHGRGLPQTLAVVRFAA